MRLAYMYMRVLAYMYMPTLAPAPRYETLQDELATIYHTGRAASITSAASTASR